LKISAIYLEISEIVDHMSKRLAIDLGSQAGFRGFRLLVMWISWISIISICSFSGFRTLVADFVDFDF